MEGTSDKWVNKMFKWINKIAIQWIKKKSSTGLFYNTDDTLK